MTKTQQNIMFWEGEFHIIPVAVVDAAAAAINLTGATITWVLLDTPRPDGATLLTKTIGGGIAVVSAALGTIEITLEEVDTAGRGGHSYYHELAIDDSAGHSEVGMIGSVRIKVSKLL